MDALAHLADGFAVALTLQNLGLALVGCFIGTIIGALPGLGPSNGVAILIPLAFTLGLPATPALILLTSVYYGAMYGGRISSILLNIPGDEPALMTTLDGYPMAKARVRPARRWRSRASHPSSARSSPLGLVFLAPLLVKLALLFGPAEYFALYTLAFATLGGIASRNQAKAAIAAALGLGIAMIGVDHQTGVPRFSFGNVHLYDGINFLVAIVGLFAISRGVPVPRAQGRGRSGREDQARPRHGAAGDAEALGPTMARGTVSASSPACFPAPAPRSARSSPTPSRSASRTRRHLRQGRSRAAWRRPRPATTPPPAARSCRCWRSACRASARRRCFSPCCSR